MGKRKTAVVIGAGPAGLTAAYELLQRTNIKPIVLERDAQYVGGISRTVNYKGNRIDIGGHRFFSKSDRVMRWWAEMLPIKFEVGEGTDITYQRTSRALTQGLRRAKHGDMDEVMEIRPRKTRILYRGEFFAYPVELSFDTLRKLGFVKVAKIGLTYLRTALFPRKPEKTLEDFFINRFGNELYETFFRSYTEKVWGVPCDQLSAEWGAQRVKGLSIKKAIAHALSKMFRLGPLSGKRVETSLIEQFLYPAYGPGFMWEKVAKKICEQGGEVRMGVDVVGVTHEDGRVVSVDARDRSGKKETITTDYIFSTTDIRTLALMFDPAPPESILKIAEGLEYRDFITVGLLLDHPPTEFGGVSLADTWMYVHEPGVEVGRVQFFHNWTPHLVADPARGWVGLEYFCTEGDTLQQKSDAELLAQAEEEMKRIGLLGGNAVIDGTVLRQPKAYPVYLGAYDRFPIVREYFDRFENLFLVGRNGMHRYNNQDHSMLAAMTAVDGIATGTVDKEAIWSVNTEEDYHEEK